jgi:hypothetical protein
MVDWLIFVPVLAHEPYDWPDHMIFYRTMAGEPAWHGDNIKDFTGHCGVEIVRLGEGRSDMWHGLYSGSQK